MLTPLQKQQLVPRQHQAKPGVGRAAGKRPQGTPGTSPRAAQPSTQVCRVTHAVLAHRIAGRSLRPPGRLRTPHTDHEAIAAQEKRGSEPSVSPFTGGSPTPTIY